MEQKLKEIAYKVWCTNDIKSVLTLDLEKVEYYNNIPVTWCTTCGSLSIMDVDIPLKEEVKCYCGKCYGTSTTKGHIQDWINKTKK